MIGSETLVTDLNKGWFHL